MRFREAHHGRGSTAGFTLVELLVTVVMAAILVSAAVPSFQGTLHRNRVLTTTNQLVAALNTARSEAVKLGVPVYVCAGALPCAGTSTNFSQGWSVCNQPSGCLASAPGSGSTPPPVLTGGPLAAGMSANASNSIITFNPAGQLQGAPPVPVNIVVCADSAGALDALNAGGVTVAPLGRVRLADRDPATGAPMIEGDTGDMQSCAAP